MYEFNHVTYKAIITISVPDVEQPYQVQVVLAPADKIEVNRDGLQLKPLRECTVAELREYANQLEQETWKQYNQIKLLNLAQDDLSQVQITVVDDQDQPLPADEEWLGACLVLPAAPAAEETPAAVEEVAQTAVAENSEPEIEVETVVEEITIVPPAEVEEITITELPTKKPAATGEQELLFEIKVLEAELVHEEREPSATPVRPPAHTDEPPGRTAGERLPLNSSAPHAVDVLMDERCLRHMQTHALSSMSREVAGVMVGPHPEKQADGRYIVHVTDTIIAQHTRMHGASVTYTPESWRYITDVMMERYPDEEAVIVGWYHTHPGFGIFLSNMDLFIHHNFFTQKWHIAYVLDPVGKRSGFFTWDRKQKEVLAYNFPWPYWAHRSW